MPDFAAAYHSIVLGSHFDALVKAYLWAIQGNYSDPDWNPDPESDQFDRERIRQEHTKLIGARLDPIARNLVCRHLFGPAEIEGLLHLLAREDRRFKGLLTEVEKSHARYASRYAFQDLDALVTKCVPHDVIGRDNQQDYAWRPLYRHLLREIIVRCHAAKRDNQSSAPVDWKVVLKELMAHLEHELASGVDPVMLVSDLSSANSDPEDNRTILDSFSTDDDIWLPPARSVGSNYDRNDGAHIRRLVEYVTLAPGAPEIAKAERKRRAEFRTQLGLRFAYTAYTHIVRGISNYIAKQKDLHGTAESTSEQIHNFILEALARCGIAECGDFDCGDALSWLRSVRDSTPFGKTFDDRLSRARDAVASEIRKTWDQPVGERLDDFLASKSELIEEMPHSHVSKFLDDVTRRTTSREEWIEHLTEETFAKELRKSISTDRLQILDGLDVNLDAWRIDYGKLQEDLGAGSPELQLWELVDNIEEAYAALFTLARMRRNAPMRVFKYFTTICRKAENKGKDAEAVMDLPNWLTTTERLLSGFEDRYLSEAFPGPDQFVAVTGWIEKERASETDSGRRALLPYFSLWNRLLEGCRPTSRAVPYLNSVEPILKPWFLKATHPT